MAQVWFTTSIVGFLCCLSVLSACIWDPDTEINQGLDPKSFNDNAPYLTHLSEIMNVEQCQRACCEREDCQLALIGKTADGPQECNLVNCMKDGKDVCVLSPTTQFQVYRKIAETTKGQKNQAEVRTPDTTDHCRFPSAVGNCRAAFPRFFYDITDQTCKSFIYGGCGGNENNFYSQAECEASCLGVKGAVEDARSVSPRSRMSGPEIKNDVDPKALTEMTSEEFQEKCQSPAVTGNCRASIKRFYYNNGVCQQFIYGGCGGNKNNYESEDSCMTACTVKIIPKEQEGPVIPAIPKSAHSFEEKCVVPSDSGPCRASFRMFFFEASSQSCQPFIYGGCRGNLNRYGSEEECMSVCSTKDGRFDEHGHEKHRRWTPAFFLVATLAIMSALLLVGLILIVVRRNSHPHFRILDDKEELLPAEEPVSYEKLPKEI